MTAHFQNLRRWATSFHFLEVEHGIFLQATFKMLWRNYDIWSMIWSLLTCWRDRHFWYLQGPDTGISYQVCLLSTVPSLSDWDSVWCDVWCILCSVLVVLSCVAAEGWAAPSSLYPFVWCREGTHDSCSVLWKYILSCIKVFYYSFGILYSFLRKL